jgi:hypothetical protein
MLQKPVFPPRLLALCTSVALALSAGCSADSPTVAGPDAQPNQEIRGATQISGIGSYALPGECDDLEGSSYNLTLTGDLEGCHYVFIESTSCTAGGAYTERGTETFIGSYNGLPGTFSTTYLFTGTFTDCTIPAGEIAGRCQHPIVTDSGTGVFEAVTGRLDFQDDIEAGNFPYRGHFRWATNDLLASSSTAFSSGTLAAPGSLPGC